MADTTETSTKFQFATLENLELFKTLMDADVLQSIDEAVASSIKTVSQSEDKTTLYFYTKEAPVTEDEAAFSVVLPAEVDITVKADKVSGAVEGDFAALDAEGNLTDSGYNWSDITSADDTVKSELIELIGSIPADSVAENIVAYIQEAVESSTYDDSELRSAVESNTTAIDVLNGTGEGSVYLAVANALVEFVAGAPESLDTYKELTDWILNHSSDAAEMNSQINQNTSDIAELTALIGTIPESSDAATIIDYISEYVAEIVVGGDLDRYALATDLDAAVDRISAIESSLTTDEANIASNTDRISALEALIGSLPEGTEATTVIGYIEELVSTINNQYTDLLARMSAAEDEIEALQSDMSTAQTNISTNTTNITANADAIAALQELVGDGYEAIDEESIRALFA